MPVRRHGRSSVLAGRIRRAGAPSQRSWTYNYPHVSIDVANSQPVYVYDSAANSGVQPQLNGTSPAWFCWALYAYDASTALTGSARSTSRSRGVVLTYAYAGDDPVNGTDPDGQCTVGTVLTSSSLDGWIFRKVNDWILKELMVQALLDRVSQ
jgi:hypothetical protein